MDYSDLIAGLLGGLLGSMITALVSLHILRKQFMREEKTIRETRASEIMENIEASIWAILSGYINEPALEEKYHDEFYQLPGTDEGSSARPDLFHLISEEKMRANCRVQDAERKLIQQRSLIELFVGSGGVRAFDEMSKKVPIVKKSLDEYMANRLRLDLNHKMEIKLIRPDDAEAWSDYSEAVSKLRKILWEYTHCKSFGSCFFCFSIRSKLNG